MSKNRNKFNKFKQFNSEWSKAFSGEKTVKLSDLDNQTQNYSNDYQSDSYYDYGSSYDEGSLYDYNDYNQTQYYDENAQYDYGQDQYYDYNQTQYYDENAQYDYSQDNVQYDYGHDQYYDNQYYDQQYSYNDTSKYVEENKHLEDQLSLVNSENANLSSKNESLNQEVTDLNVQIQQLIEENQALKANDLKMKQSLASIEASIKAKYENTENELREQLRLLKNDFDVLMEERKNALSDVVKAKEQELVADNQEEISSFKRKIVTKDIGEIINIIEQFEKVLSYPIDDPKIANYTSGFKMFASMFVNALKSMGVNRVNIPLGSEPDFNLCEVTEQIPGTEYDSGKICMIDANAYEYEGKIIKYAKVKVAI